MKISAETIEGCLSFEDAREYFERAAKLLQETEDEQSFRTRMESCECVLNLLKRYKNRLLTVCDFCGEKKLHIEDVYSTKYGHTKICQKCKAEQCAKEQTEDIKTKVGLLFKVMPV